MTNIKYKLFLKVLLAFNILTLALLLIILIRENYPNRIANKLNLTSEKKQNENNAETLKKMNPTFNVKFTDTTSQKLGQEFKVLVLGNSIARHEILKEIGWTHISGMAATNIENDYAHLLFKQLQNELPDKKVSLRIINFAFFERMPSILNLHLIDTITSYNPNLVIFQLGENVSPSDSTIFKEKYIELIKSFQKKGNPIVICTTPFFPSLENNKMIAKVAIATKSFLVDLSNLPLLDEENYAKNEKQYKGNKREWKVNGIGIHPGDKGMKNIEEQLYLTIVAALANRQN